MNFTAASTKTRWIVSADNVIEPVNAMWYGEFPGHSTGATRLR